MMWNINGRISVVINKYIEIVFNPIITFSERYLFGRKALKDEIGIFLKPTLYRIYIKEKNTNLKDNLQRHKEYLIKQEFAQKKSLKYKLKYRYSSLWIFGLLLIVFYIFYNLTNINLIYFIYFWLGSFIVYELFVCSNSGRIKWITERINFEFDRCNKAFNVHDINHIFNFDSKLTKQDFKYKLKRILNSICGIIKSSINVYKQPKHLFPNFVHISAFEKDLNDFVNKIDDWELKHYLEVRFNKALKDLYYVSYIDRVLVLLLHFALVFQFIVVLYGPQPNDFMYISIDFFRVFSIIIWSIIISIPIMLFLSNIFVLSNYNSYIHNYRYYTKGLKLFNELKNEYTQEYKAEKFILKTETLFKNEILNYFKIV